MYIYIDLIEIFFFLNTHLENQSLGNYLSPQSIVTISIKDYFERKAGHKYLIYLEEKSTLFAFFDVTQGSEYF